jgi:hypothetical protein
VLLAPSLDGLSKMTQICLDFAQEFNMEFNGDKSQFIVFRPTKKNYYTKVIKVGSANVIEQQKVSHLGFAIYSDLSVRDTAGVTAAFYRQYNVF